MLEDTCLHKSLPGLSWLLIQEKEADSWQKKKLSKVEVEKVILTKLSRLMNFRSRHKNQSTAIHNSRITFHSVRIDETGLVRIFELLVMEKVLRQSFFILVSPISLHLHNGSLAPLHTLPGLHLQVGHTVQLGGVTYLRLVMIRIIIIFSEKLCTSSP